MSYYKYAERSSESRVDWNEISKGMVDMLKEQTRLRNEKLDEAVKLQGEVTTALSDAPMGSDTNANQRVSQFAADAQEYSLMMNKLWRSGEMSYREYMAATNNFKTNTEGYLSQAEKYAANYEKHVKRMEEQIASGVEVSELARVEDFGNFSRFTPVIDAPTGSIGLVGEDGQKYASVSQLGVAVMSTYDRLDVEGRTKAVADQMGKTVEVIMSDEVRTLENALQNENYVKAEDDAVSGILTGDNAYTSVLVDFKSGLYSTTHDINDAINDPNAILMVPSSRNSDRMIGAVEDDAAFERYIDEQATRNGQPLTDGEKAILRKNRDAQREQSFEAVRDQLRARLNFVETPQAEFPDSTGATRTTAGERGLLRQGVAGLRSLEKLHGGNEEEATEGLQNLLDRNYSKFSDGTVTIDEETGERTAVLVRYNPDTKQKEEVAIPIPASVLNTIDAFGPQFFDESTRAYLYEAYDTEERLYGGKPGTATPSVSRPRAVSADNLDAEVVEFAGEEIDFATALSTLNNEPSAYVAVTKGLRLANANASTLSSIAGQLNLNAEIGVLPEDDMEEKLGFDPEHTAVTMKFPDVNGFEVVILNDTEGVNAQRQLFREMAKRKINGESMTVDEILKYLPSNSRKLNQGETHEKIAAGGKMRLADWKAANAAAIEGKTLMEINMLYKKYFDQ